MAGYKMWFKEARKVGMSFNEAVKFANKHKGQVMHLPNGKVK